jgi:hypothetical protein
VIDDGSKEPGDPAVVGTRTKPPRRRVASFTGQSKFASFWGPFPVGFQKRRPTSERTGSAHRSRVRENRLLAVSRESATCSAVGRVRHALRFEMWAEKGPSRTVTVASGPFLSISNFLGAERAPREVVNDFSAESARAPRGRYETMIGRVVPGGDSRCRWANRHAGLRVRAYRRIGF